MGNRVSTWVLRLPIGSPGPLHWAETLRDRIDSLSLAVDAAEGSFKAKLKRAERMMARFSATAERALNAPVTQLAAFLKPTSSMLPNNETAREEVSVEVGEGGAAATQAVAA